METLHSLSRKDFRINASGIDLNNLIENVTILASQHVSVGILALKLKKEYNKNRFMPYSNQHKSNGNEVWAICRDGKIVTWMFRRDNQPKTQEALKVDKIIVLGRLKGNYKC